MNSTIQNQIHVDEPTPIKKVILISLLASLVLSLTIGRWMHEASIIGFLKNLFGNFVFCISLWLGNEYLVYFLNRRISWLEKPVLRFFISFFATITMTIMIVVVLQTFFYYLYFNQPILNVIRRIDFGDFYITVIITAVVSLFLHGRAFLMGWRETALEAEKLKRAHISAQYETLKNQVNPHFLFNSLNVLSTLVYKDQDLAAKFIKQLSTVYRYVLDTRDKEVVSLKEELAALESYIFLIKIRFGENLIIHTDIKAQSDEMVVPLTLQMLLENVVKHNEISRMYPLNVELKRAEPGWMYMKNTLREKRQVHQKSGVGLPNIEARYQYITDDTIQIHQTEDTFEVKIPIVNIK